MLLYVPFIYFSSLFLFIIKRNGFDVSACMTLMYIITSFFAILLGNTDIDFGYSNYSKIEINFAPTIAYCLLISMCIYPFYRYNSNLQREILKIEKVWLFNLICYGYFAVFILLLIIFWHDLTYRFFSADFNELRQAVYEGELHNAVDQMSGESRLLATILTILGSGSFFMIFFFFYSACILKQRLFFNIMVLIGSLSCVLIGTLNIDRSSTVFWIMIFILAYTFFRPYINLRDSKRSIRILIFSISIILIYYLLQVTISRFGGREFGASGGMFFYIGQPFINFCHIWNDYDHHFYFTDRILPLTHYLLTGENGNQIAKYVEEAYQGTGVHINVFFSFVGMFLVDLGYFGAVIMTTFLYLLISKFINKHRKREYINFFTLYGIIAFGIIIQCGIITYYYSSMQRTIALLLFFIISLMLSREKNPSF